ncbi:MAG: FTR1 family protein [Thermomicrobiales bacterium]
MAERVAKSWLVGWRAVAVGLVALVVIGVVAWQAITAHGAPDPTAHGLTPAAVILNSGILVFREGLEAILVLAAIAASLLKQQHGYGRAILAGAGAALLASVATWFIVVAIISAVNAPALDVQAATGLLAIVVLLVIMNWFFHRIYWTGWIAHHNKRRREIVEKTAGKQAATYWGLALLGFTAVYREGFEIVLFLQSLRLQAGSGAVLKGAAIGLGLTLAVAILTFAARQKLPYKKMLVLTGIMLGAVLVVMVGESVQELQLAGWLSTTAVGPPLPDWLGVWFALFSNVEGLVAQVCAAIFVIGSYFAAEYVRVWRPRRQFAARQAA